MAQILVLVDPLDLQRVPEEFKDVPDIVASMHSTFLAGGRLFIRVEAWPEHERDSSMSAAVKDSNTSRQCIMAWRPRVRTIRRASVRHQPIRKKQNVCNIEADLVGPQPLNTIRILS